MDKSQRVLGSFIICDITSLRRWQDNLSGPEERQIWLLTVYTMTLFRRLADGLPMCLGLTQERTLFSFMLFFSRGVLHMTTLKHFLHFILLLILHLQYYPTSPSLPFDYSQK